MIKLALCDDSKDTIRETENMIEELFSKDIEYDAFYSGEELLGYLEKNKEETFDIFLLDIEMAQLTGLETAKTIRKLSKEAIIIFVTSHSEYIYDVFDVLAFNFIVKPLRIEKLKEVLQKALLYLGIMNKKFYYKVNNVEYTIDSSDIIYFESEKRKMILYTEKDEHIFYETVANTYHKLEKLVFIQCHASYIVNMKYIQSLTKEKIVLTNDMEIPISKRYKDIVIETYHSFLRRKM